MRPFFIAALPRSRTAWLANYLTCGDMVCLHDAWRECGTAAELRARFDRTGANFCGCSDPMNVMMREEIDAEFPGAAWILVFREAREVMRSVRNLEPCRNYSNVATLEWERELLRCADRPHCMTIRFDKINTSTARNIARFVGSDDFDSGKERDAMLDRFNVQIHKPILEREIMVVQESVRNHQEELCQR